MSPDHMRMVCGILQKHLLPDVRAWVFGSRAKWTATDASDLDLALEGDGKIGYETMDALECAFEESDLPYKVDVVDLHRVNHSFRHIIEAQMTTLPILKNTSNNTNGQPMIALGDVADLRMSGVDKKIKNHEQSVLLCNYTDVYNNNFIHSGMDFMMATATEHEISKYALTKGDVIITIDSEKYNDIGVPALVRENIRGLICGYHLAILRPTPKIDGTYLYYVLETSNAALQFQLYANGITRFGLRRSDIERVEIPLLSLNEQRTAARILSALDDKIELNRRMNQTLEGMARALFKSWFVGFDPVRAKMDGRWSPGESLPGLPAHLYDLFPDSLVDSELGEIPERWSAGILDDYFNLTMGRSPPSDTCNDEGRGLPFFQGSADFGLRYPRNRKYCTAPARVAHADDTLVSVKAPVGAMNMAWDECCAGRGVAALRHKTGSRSFTYYLVWSLRHDLKQYEQVGTMSGSITKKQLETLPIVEPPTRLVGCFEACVSAWDERIRLNTSESRLLMLQRDALLPKLVSGEFRPCPAG